MCRFSLPFVFGLCTALFLAATGQAQGQKKNRPIRSEQEDVLKDAFGDPLPYGAIARIGTTRYRLLNMRQDTVMSSDGKYLAAIDNNVSEIVVWELPAWANRRVIRSRDLDGKKPPHFQQLEFAADSRKLITFDSEGQFIYMLDVTTGKTIKKLGVGNKKIPGVLSEWTVSRDQNTLVLLMRGEAGEKKPVLHVQIWDLATDLMTKSFDLALATQDGLNDGSLLGVSADGRRLAVTRSKEEAKPKEPNFNERGEEFIEIWDLTIGKAVRKIDPENHHHFVFSPDGKWIASADGLSALRIYDAATGAEKHSIRLRRDGVNHMVPSPDSKSLYVGHFNGKVSRWDIATGETTASYNAPAGAAYLEQLAFTPSGKAFALGQFVEALTLWDLETGKAMSPLNLPSGPITSMTFSGNGELFIGGSAQSHAWWNPRTAAKIRDVKLELADGPPYDLALIMKALERDSKSITVSGGGLTQRAALSATGQFLTSGDYGVSVFDAKTGKLLYDDDAIDHLQLLCFFDGDAKAAAIYKNKIRIWNARTGRDLDRFEIPLKDKEPALRFAASPSGNHVALTTSDHNEGRGRTVLCDTALKKIVREWPRGDSSQSIAFSSDHKWLAVMSAQDPLLLTRIGAANGVFKLQLPAADNGISELSFSPDSRQLACAALISADKKRESSRIYIYEVASKRIRLELAGHADATIMSLGYDHDSGLLASGSTDTTALVWRAGLSAFAEIAAKRDVAPEELATRFKLMGDADAKVAFQAMIQLVQSPAQTVKLLDAKIAPAVKLDTGGKTVAEWVNDLGNGQFAIRNKANAMLKKIGASVELDLRAALLKATDVETKRRMEELLEHFAAYEWTPEELLHARAVEVLEAIATPDARALLTRWADGGTGAVLTIEARRALARLDRTAKADKSASDK